tara:strand:- start:1468 stop:2796 length:1329 start_codon:yes stop_codon:yes gene_type:complete
MIFDNVFALQSRIKLVLSSFVDFLIINTIFFIYIPNEKLFSIGPRQFFYILFWVLISYIFDRYNQDRINNENSDFLNQLFNSIKSIIIFGLIFLFFNWILGNYTGRSFLLILLFNLFIYSSISQYLIYRFLFKKFIKLKYWTFLKRDGSEDLIKKLVFLKEDKIQVLFFDNIKESYKLILNSYGIIINDFDDLSKDDISLLLDLKKTGVKIYKLSNWLKIFLKRYPPDLLNSKDFLSVEFLLLNNSLLMRVKRLGDIFISIFLLLITFPLFCVLGPLIYFEDKGPVFYSQKRSGFLNGEFTIWKLRSMKVNAEEDGIRWSSKDDKRITKIGSFLRKTRIDELPQLWSVLVGDMSLIGPRPERPEIDIYLKENIPFYAMRYLLRPGLSGWSQVNYPYGASLKDSTNKLSFDLYYIANYSFWLDVLIFLRTLRLILNARGSKPQ